MREALIIVDMQNDFMDIENAALPVPGATEIVPGINKLRSGWDNKDVYFTLDWHPESHISFNDWPVHCVECTWGSKLYKHIDYHPLNKIIYKGNDPNIEQYSAFAAMTDEKLNIFLAKYNSIVICGVATEYCVMETAKDAVNLGLEVSVRLDLCRGINEGN